jgi:hypothetical protein
LIEGAIATLPMTFSAFDSNLRFTYVAGGMERAWRERRGLLG